MDVDEMVSVALAAKVPTLYKVRCPDCHAWVARCWEVVDGYVVQMHTRHSEFDPETGRLKRADGPSSQAFYVTPGMLLEGYCDCFRSQLRHTYRVDDGIRLVLVDHWAKS